jgi:V/A-type H+-transporting ATPase subunit E
VTEPQDVPDLEAALIERAERLAAEYLARAGDGREAILKEERERLHSLEERISQEAGTSADRLYSRRVQAAQLRLQGNLDRLRWGLIQSVVADLPNRLAAMADDEAAYEQLLQALLAHAVQSMDESMGDEDLVAEFNDRDLARLRDRWDTFCEQAVPGRSIDLNPDPCQCSGGVRVSNRDNRICIDATFEGRMERFRDDLLQTIAERLFASNVGHSD